MIIMLKETVLNQIKPVCNEGVLIVDYDYKDVNYHATARAKVEEETGNKKHSKWYGYE